MAPVAPLLTLFLGPVRGREANLRAHAAALGPSDLAASDRPTYVDPLLSPIVHDGAISFDRLQNQATSPTSSVPLLRTQAPLFPVLPVPVPHRPHTPSRPFCSPPSPSLSSLSPLRPRPTHPARHRPLIRQANF